MGFATAMEVWEPSLNRWKDGKWVAAKLDLRLENFAVKLAVNPTVVDVSIVHVTSPSYLLTLRGNEWCGKKENLTVVDMLTFREQNKHGEYQVRDEGGRRRTALRLIPFVVNNYGSWGESAVSFLKRACMFSGKRGKFVVDQVSLAIARNIARRLRQAIGAVTWDRPGLPVTIFEQTSQTQRPTPSSDPADFEPPSPGLAPEGAEDCSPAVGAGLGMSAALDGSVNSTSVAQRTTFWQAQGGKNGVPPPGNHRGPGALPATTAQNHTVASFMQEGKSVHEAKGAKRRAMCEKLAAGSIGVAGKGPADSVWTPENATGALVPGVLDVAAVEVGQHGSVVAPRVATGALAPGVLGVAAGQGDASHVFEAESFFGERASDNGAALVDPSGTERAVELPSPLRAVELPAPLSPISPGERDSERAARVSSVVPISPGQHESERAERVLHGSPGQHERFLAQTSGVGASVSPEALGAPPRSSHR